MMNLALLQDNKFEHNTNSMFRQLCITKRFPCAYAIVFMKHCTKEPHTFIQPKYTAATGSNALNLSLGRIKENSVPETNVTELKFCSPRIIPPHVRAPRGRPRKKTDYKGK